MTHSFLLAFCHLHIILHFFSRSLLLSFHPFFPSHLILLLFFLSLSFSFFTTSFCFLHSPRLHLFSCVFFLVSICSFCNIRRREEFHLRNTSVTFVFSLGGKEEKNVILIPGYSNSNFLSMHSALALFNLF